MARPHVVASTSDAPTACAADALALPTAVAGRASAAGAEVAVSMAAAQTGALRADAGCGQHPTDR